MEKLGQALPVDNSLPLTKTLPKIKYPEQNKMFRVFLFID